MPQAERGAAPSAPDPLPLVLSINDVARHLRLLRRNGEPNRRAVHELIRSRALRVVDDTQGIQRWTVASSELLRYITDGPAAPR